MALRNQPYLPLYVQDFITDEKLMECSAAATGLYIKIMCIMHKSESYGTILLKQKDKQNPKQVENFARKLAKFLPWDLPTVLQGLEELLQEKVLSIDGDLLIQKRMVKDGDISDKRSASGSKGGKITTNKHTKFAQAKTQANSENENEVENEVEYVDVSEAEKKKKSLKIPKVQNSDFELFWELYGKKTDTAKCKAKFATLKPDEVQMILEVVENYVKSTPDTKYRKNPITWLNGKCWNDEIIFNLSPNGSNSNNPQRTDIEFKQSAVDSVNAMFGIK